MPAHAPQAPANLARSAFETIALRGIGNANLDDIAARAGVTKGSLYWHYTSKRALLDAACAYYYRTWHRRVNAEIAGTPDPFERLERAVRFSVRSCLLDKRNRLFTTDVFALSLHDEQVRRGWAQFYDSAREFFVGLVTAAKLAGRLDTPDPRAAVEFMLAAFEGIKQRASFEPRVLSEEDAICQGLMELLAVLGGRGDARAPGPRQTEGKGHAHRHSHG